MSAASLSREAADALAEAAAKLTISNDEGERAAQGRVEDRGGRVAAWRGNRGVLWRQVNGRGEAGDRWGGDGGQGGGGGRGREARERWVGGGRDRGRGNRGGWVGGGARVSGDADRAKVSHSMLVRSIDESDDRAIAEQKLSQYLTYNTERGWEYSDGYHLSWWPRRLPLLQLAAKYGRRNWTEVLLTQYMADISAKTQGERHTALHQAAFYGHRDVVVTLLKHGADPMFRNKEGRTPLGSLHWARDQRTHDPHWDTGRRNFARNARHGLNPMWEETIQVLLDHMHPASVRSGTSIAPEVSERSSPR
eukprot:767497-Hanusia_phi.AAC.3